MPAKQGRYFILTIPRDKWEFPTELPDYLAWIKGQAEVGEGGYEHWQVCIAFPKNVTATKCKTFFPEESHVEFTRSAAADEYVHKEESSVAGTRFEYGQKSKRRNNANDWNEVWDQATSGRILDIPADIRIRCYHTLKRIRKDYDEAPWREDIIVNVFTGVTGSGKSHRMFEEAGRHCYIKPSTTKWWDGYRGESNVVIDEFRGQISIEHMLRWFDKYPCFVEEKGGQVALKATKFWVASNLSVEKWFPDADPATLAALKRRIHVTEFTNAYKAQEARHVDAVNHYEEYDPGFLDRLLNDDFE